jgi:LuxR family maltose regulon positive regulatory protein
MAFCNISSYVSPIGHPQAPGEFERRVAAFAATAPRIGYFFNAYIVSMEDLARAELAYFQGDLDTAEQYARRTVIKAREQNQYEIENRALFFLLRLCIHRGSPEELLETWKQKNSLLSITDYENRETINDVYDGWMHIHLNEPDKTPSWLRSRFEVSDLYSMLLNFESLVKAKYLYAVKQYAEAAAFLTLKENQNGLGSFLLGLLEMNCLEAAARCRMGEEAEALALLEKTWQEASPNSLTMPFIELGYDMRTLANLALEAGSIIPRPWLEDIRSRASAYGKNLYAIAEQLRGREGPGAAVYLTRLERMVLQGLSRGQKREEIAAAAGQPLSAVKSAISRTCEKLGAVNRADAVRIASAMGLFGANGNRQNGDD